MSDNVRKIFARNLTYYIAQSGRTQKELADMLGVAQSTFNNWCTGVRYPRMDKVEQLANYFGIQKSDLIEEKKSAENDGLSEGRKALIDFVKTVPDEKAAMILQVMRTILSDGK